MSYCPIVWGNETGQGTGHIFNLTFDIGHRTFENLDLYGQGQ